MRLAVQVSAVLCTLRESMCHSAPLCGPTVWEVFEMLGLIGAPGWVLVRIDQCTSVGTPYQKPQLWLTNMEALATLPRTA